MTIVMCDSCKKQNRKALGRTVYLPKCSAVDRLEVRELEKRGLKIQEIADRFDLTPRRVWQILAEQN